MAKTYDEYLKKLGGRRVNAGEDWKDVHEEVLKGYAASHPDNPIPQASGGGEIGAAIGQATERSGPPQLGILPNRSATTSATSAGAPLPEAPAIKPSKPLSPGTVLGSTMRDLPPVDPNSAPATVAPVVAPANAGVDGIPTGGPEGWKGGEPNQAPKTAFGDLQATIQNQVEKAVWGSTLTPQPSNAAPPKQEPAQASYSNEGRNYPAGSSAQSPAVTTAQAGIPQRNAAGALTSLGAGTDVVGDGIKKYVVDGKTLYSNVGDGGPGGNLSLMNRGAPTAQNQAAMNALLQRDAAERSQQVAALQFQDQVRQAQANNDANARLSPPNQYNPLDLRDPTNIARRNFETSLSRNPGESDKAYQLRASALIDARKITDTNTANTNTQQLAAQRLSADIVYGNQQLAQSGQKIGIDKAGLSLMQQQVANEVATGEQNRAVAGMSLDAARKVSDLQAQYMAAEGDPKTRAKLAQSIRDLTGKEAKADWKFHATPTIKNADGSTTEGTAYMVNERTNEVVKVGDQKKQPAATRQYEVGKTYTMSVNGTPGNYRFIGFDGNGKEMWKPA